MKQLLKQNINLLLLISIVTLFIGCEKGPDFKIVRYPAQTATGFSPASGYPGIYVAITGKNFGTLAGAVKVFFGGVKADSVISCGDSQIVVKVPAGALTGKVTLQIWTNTDDSIGHYTVIPAPVISSVSTDGGAPGDTLIIKGTGFGGDLSKILVSFNGTTGTPISVFDTSLSVIVPAGFTSGNITVYVNGYALTGRAFAYLTPVPNPLYELDFEGNLNDKMGGAAATFTQGSGSPLSYVTGVNGQAVSLAGYANSNYGANQCIKLPAGISAYNELTVACWVSWKGQLDQESIFEFGATRGNRLLLVPRMPGWWNGAGTNIVGRIIYEKDPTVASGAYIETNLITGSPLSLNTWHHLAMTISSSNSIMKVYLDGVLVGSKALPAGATVTTFNHADEWISGCHGSEPAFGGSIDKFQIYNSVLSANQIYTIYYKK